MTVTANGNFEPRPTIDGHAVSRASTASVSICAAGQSHADHATDAHVGRRCVGRQIGPAIYSAGTFVPSTWIASSHVEGLSLYVTRSRQARRHKRLAVCALGLSDRLPRRGSRRCQAAPSAPRRLADCPALLATGATVKVPPHGRAVFLLPSPAACADGRRLAIGPCPGPALEGGHPRRAATAARTCRRRSCDCLCLCSSRSSVHGERRGRPRLVWIP